MRANGPRMLGWQGGGLCALDVWGWWGRVVASLPEGASYCLIVRFRVAVFQRVRALNCSRRPENEYGDLTSCYGCAGREPDESLHPKTGAYAPLCRHRALTVRLVPVY